MAPAAIADGGPGAGLGEQLGVFASGAGGMSRSRDDPTGERSPSDVQSGASHSEYPRAPEPRARIVESFGEGTCREFDESTAIWVGSYEGLYWQYDGFYDPAVQVVRAVSSGPVEPSDMAPAKWCRRAEGRETSEVGAALRKALGADLLSALPECAHPECRRRLPEVEQRFNELSSKVPESQPLCFSHLDDHYEDCELKPWESPEDHHPESVVDPDGRLSSDRR